MEEGKNFAGKPIRCKAAVCREAGTPLVIEEIMVAPPMQYEVRIRIICASLCHSDVTFWKLKEPPAVFPTIFGHEAVGLLFVPLCHIMHIFQNPTLDQSLSFAADNNIFWIVESIGEDVHEVSEGDMVIPTLMSDCGDCPDCKSEESNLCSNFPLYLSPYMPRHKTSRFTDLKGEVLYHFLFVSSFSEYTVVDVTHVVKIDHPIPPNMVCALGCGVSTGIGAAWKTAQIKAGSTVVIIGLGTIGLAVAEGARISGAARVIGVDVIQEKSEIAKKFGVTDFVNSKDIGDKSVSQVINEMTGGGADYCFECVGIASLVEEAYACCRKGWGKTIMVGVDKPGAQLSFDSYGILMSGKILMGSLFGGIKIKSDIPLLLKRYQDKELQLDKFVTHEVAFEEINKAFELLLEGKSLRCVIWMANEFQQC